MIGSLLTSKNVKNNFLYPEKSILYPKKRLLYPKKKTSVQQKNHLGLLYPKKRLLYPKKAHPKTGSPSAITSMRRCTIMSAMAGCRQCIVRKLSAQLPNGLGHETSWRSTSHTQLETEGWRRPSSMPTRRLNNLMKHCHVPSS